MGIPELVDLQVNGYKGVDFSSPNLTNDDFIWACQELLEAGTMAFLPTIITSHEDVYKRNLPLIAAVLDTGEFRGRLLGIHLEGPFISAEEGVRGMHNPEWTKKPDIGYCEQLIEWADGNVKLITIAADMEGADQLASYAVSRGVTVSLGHQMANEEDLQKLVQAGAVALTHSGNGIPAMLPRHNNPIWAGLANDDLSAMIITDGHHLPASVIKTIIRTKGAERCIIVSDSSSLAGLDPSEYEILGQKLVLEENGRLYNPATGYLAGSSATMLECINYLDSLNLVNPDELFVMGFNNPLKLIGLNPEDVAIGKNLYCNQKEYLFAIKNNG